MILDSDKSVLNTLKETSSLKIAYFDQKPDQVEKKVHKIRITQQSLQSKK